VKKKKIASMRNNTNKSKLVGETREKKAGRQKKE